MIIIETAPEPSFWGTLLNDVSPWLLFLLGLILGPFGKAREALFLEERHNRRLAQELAREAMNDIAAIEYQKFQRKTGREVHHATLRFRQLLGSEKYAFNPRDRAAAEQFIEAMTVPWNATSKEAFEAGKPALYEAYLNLRRPILRFRARRAALKKRQPPVRRSDFNGEPPAVSGSNAEPGRLNE